MCVFQSNLVVLTVYRNHRVMLSDLFIPMLEASSEAPPESSLRDTNLNQIADFLIHLCAPQKETASSSLFSDVTFLQEDSVHESLAMTVANAVLTEPANKSLSKAYCRALTKLNLTTSENVRLF